MGDSRDPDAAPPTLPATPSAQIVRAIEDLAARVEIIIERGSSPPPSGNALATPVPASRPSMAARAAKTTGKFGQWALIGLGAATLVAQVVALKYPAQVGPVRALLESLLAAFGGPR